MSKKRYQKRRKKHSSKFRLARRLATTVLLVLVIILGVLVVKKFVLNDGGNGQGETIKNGTEEPHSMEVIKRADASYERWLAAAMVTGISMQYSDFQIEKIYLSEETPLEKKADSQGTFVIFITNGKEIAIHSVPLKKERTKAETLDLYEEELGFATFDIVDVSEIDTETCQEIGMEELEELISQSLLVSVYEHY